jgi:hypothetical protein
LKEAPDAFLGQMHCVQAVTIEPWRAMYLLSALSVITLPCLVYIIAARKHTTV